jgi:hypothetical protein
MKTQIAQADEAWLEKEKQRRLLNIILQQAADYLAKEG